MWTPVHICVQQTFRRIWAHGQTVSNKTEFLVCLPSQKRRFSACKVAFSQQLLLLFSKPLHQPVALLACDQNRYRAVLREVLCSVIKWTQETGTVVKSPSSKKLRAQHALLLSRVGTVMLAAGRFCILSVGGPLLLAAGPVALGDLLNEKEQTSFLFDKYYGCKWKWNKWQ